MAFGIRGSSLRPVWYVSRMNRAWHSMTDVENCVSCRMVRRTGRPARQISSGMWWVQSGAGMSGDV